MATSQREALATDLARILSAEGIEETSADMIADEAARLVQFDAMGCAIDLGAVVNDIKVRDQAIITRKPASDHQAKPATVVGAVATAGPNPWSNATRNITRQCVITLTDPMLAARLQREAGA